MMRSLTAVREPTTTNFLFMSERASFMQETELRSQTVVSSRERAKERGKRPRETTSWSGTSVLLSEVVLTEAEGVSADVERKV